MRYKIHHEPMYVFECKSILHNIINGATIKDEMEEVIQKRGLQSKRLHVEKLFQNSITLEQYSKENICLNLPGYEDTGQEMAEFLFKEFEITGGDNVTPFNAVDDYNFLLSIGIDNKAAAILFGLHISRDDWEKQIAREIVSPPSIDDSEFFMLVNNSHYSQEEKLCILKLYFDFATYHAYTHALLQYTEGLLKDKINGCIDDVQTHMQFVEKQLLTNNAVFTKNKYGISANDDQLYHVYPGIYRTNCQTLSWPLHIPSPARVIIGTSVFKLEELCDNVESDDVKTTQFLNCLSDSTKQAILKLLKQEPLYGSQLAEKLNCTGANISQHMSALSDLGVVYIKKENTRVYYHLNKEVIHKHLEDAKWLFG